MTWVALIGCVCLGCYIGAWWTRRQIAEGLAEVLTLEEALSIRARVEAQREQA